MSEMITTLGWLCYAAGALALVVYIVHFAQRQGWKRPWNAAGLFFTSVALSQVPSLFTNLTQGQVRAAVIVSLCLAAAACLQAFAALRKRRERRTEDVAAETPAP
ncbi:MAG: hypothetical protein ACXW3D_00415 [Caulobacteraceae bacterium]